jgi:hypothetical protein
MFKSSDFNENQAGSGVQKIINPGEHYCKVVDMRLEAPPFDKDAYNIILTIETKEDDFEGLPKDRNNPSLGNYEGKIGTVKVKQYPFSTYNYGGKEITRDSQIFNWINMFAKNLGVFDKFKIEAESIEDYFNDARTIILRSQVYAYYTVAGKEYYKDGYDKPNYNLFLPKPVDRVYPYNVSYDNLLKFDENIHIIKTENSNNEPVTSFEPEVENVAALFVDTPIGDLDLP